ncbi:MAG: hypothetical protein A3G75_14620 [Verrucomicrobia bacterium RIFCSPLOWO2_12_FULL_64_8]|nr:MAG: hypothetical protein A3G75_14620 [Verrucomicrobia bacterium RIFCSPLOWO2_12_FULL_64_8]
MVVQAVRTPGAVIIASGDGGYGFTLTLMTSRRIQTAILTLNYEMTKPLEKAPAGISKLLQPMRRMNSAGKSRTHLNAHKVVRWNALANEAQSVRS